MKGKLQVVLTISNVIRMDPTQQLGEKKVNDLFKSQERLLEHYRQLQDFPRSDITSKVH